MLQTICLQRTNFGDNTLSQFVKNSYYIQEVNILLSRLSPNTLICMHRLIPRFEFHALCLHIDYAACNYKIKRFYKVQHLGKSANRGSEIMSTPQKHLALCFRWPAFATLHSCFLWEKLSNDHYLNV